MQIEDFERFVMREFPDARPGPASKKGDFQFVVPAVTDMAEVLRKLA